MRKLWLAAATVTVAGVAAVIPALTASAGPPSSSSSGPAFADVCSRKIAPGYARCMALVRTDVGGGFVRANASSDAQPAAAPDATPSSGYGPADLRSAYKLPASGGQGRTIAIVDAYDLPTAAADLNTYRSTFGLPQVNVSGGPTFRKVNQSGGSSLPAVNASWGQEIALDIDMASASCPGCNILLVEANSASQANLAAAVNYAASVPGVVAISNSYGGGEAGASSAYNHPNIAITASTGDNGYGVSYPASDPHVVAVGGTTLNRSSSSRGWSETAWSGAGSGCSTRQAKPSYQANVNTGCSRRAVADVSAVANPSTGVSVYDSTPSGGRSGWMVFGGTSASAPIIAGVYALAGGGYSPATPYSHTSSLNDVTSGRNGLCLTQVLCTAGAGWDGPTGLGTPNGLGAF